MIGIITNILRSGMMLLGAWLVSDKGVDQATVDAGTEAIINIVGVVIASGGAVWSLLRSINRSKRGVK